MKLVVGLGNPGNQYAETRHNIGWMVLDRLADRAGKAGRGRQRDASASIEVRYKGLELTLAKPQTYMNDSGHRGPQAARRATACRWPTCWSSTDDFALPFGKLRFRESGSHGGHNGLRSIIDELGTEKFSRLRIGIGEPGAGGDRPRAVAVRASTSGRGCRSCSTPRPRPSRPGPSDGHVEGGQPVEQLRAPGAGATPTDDGERPKAGEVGGPADDNGVRRTKTGWRQILPAAPTMPASRGGGRARRAAAGDATGTAAGRPASGTSPRRSPASGRSGGPPTEATEQELDLEKASVEAEVELLDPAARPEPSDGEPSRQRSDPSGRPQREAGTGRVVVPWRRPARPGPRGLPRLLHDTGSFGSLRERLGEPAPRPGCTASTSG